MRNLKQIVFISSTFLFLSGFARAGYNVLFIAVDDLRPEMACYGHPMIKSPNIDRLASEGILFERAYCQQAICAPSRISLLSGMYPETTTIFDLDTRLKDVMPNAITLPRTFHDNGYESLSIGKIYHHKNDDPLGWTKVHLETSGKDYLLPENIELNTNTGFGPPLEHADVADNKYLDGKNTQLALQELRRVKDQPFFLAVGFHRPHLPFNAPAKYRDLYNLDSITVPSRLSPVNSPDLAFTTWGELRSYTGMPSGGNLDDLTTKQLIRAYYACVSYVDAQIGLLLNELDSLGLRDSTIVVLWGDHGWKLGDYGDWCKHTNFELDTHVPMIFSIPGQTPGLRSSMPAEFVDIFPTLADICDLPIPHTVEGHSLAGHIADTSLIIRKTAYSVYGRGSDFGRTIRSGDWRYVEWRNRSTGKISYQELYDHSGGDLAIENLAGKTGYLELLDSLSLVLNNRIPKPRTYEVSFRMEAESDGGAIPGCQVQFNGEVLTTGADGKVLFTAPASLYTVNAMAGQFEPLENEMINIVSDTLIVFTLSADIPDVSLQITDLSNGEPIYRVSISYLEILKLSDRKGMVMLENLSAGMLQYTVDHDNYFIETDSLLVGSKDTSLFVGLTPRLASFFFKLMNGTSPVENARITSGSIQVFTNFEGETMFLNRPARSVHTYTIEKEGYQTLTGSFWLELDTTLTIDFQLLSSSYVPEGSEIRLYPNPAGDEIKAFGFPRGADLSLLNALGREIRRITVEADKIRISMADLPPGLYLLRTEDGLSYKFSHYQ